MSRWSRGAIALLASLVLSPDATATARGRKEAIESAGVRRSYYAYIPDSIVSSSPAPLLLLLHGSGQNGLDLMREWTELAAAEGVVLIAPNAHNRLQWQLKTDGPTFLGDIIEATASRYPIDRRRVYLFGLSGGAVYALTLSVLESEYFAATAVYAGAFRDAASLAIIPLARRKIPVSIFVGDRDEYFPMKAVTATEEALKQAGHPVMLTILKRRDHSYAGVAAKVNRSAWEFLAASRLESEPTLRCCAQSQ